MTLTVGSPVPGRVVPLAEVPDPVFAEAMVGPGVAVLPASGAVVAPVTGVIATVHPHAFVVAADSGQAVLVHLGIDTVKLQGEGFTLHVAKGDQVSAGQVVVTWDPEAVTAAGYSAACPVVALDAAADSLTDVRAEGEVEAGERLFEWH
jgi:PTS system N-acetylglucosamine-specific IIA component